MSTRWRFISTDDHVVEPPDLWTRRLARTKWGDRIPRLEHDTDGSDCWVIDGARHGFLPNGAVGALMADRSAEPRRWADVPDAAHLPVERLKAMDAGGIDYSVLYPSVAGVAGETFGRLADPELESACVQAYNDWLIEEWAAVSPRFIPQCIVPIHSIDAAVAEVKRAVARGHRGVIYPGVPRHLREALPHINDPRLDKLWLTCQELGVPICFHSGCSPELELPAYDGFSPQLAAAYKAIARPAGIIPVVSNLIVSRILERFPALKVIFSETSLGWLGFILEATDYEFDQFRVMDQTPYELHPSEAFRRQCYGVGWYDRASLQRACEYPGPENLMWAANFPLSTSPWPDSRSANELCFKGLPDQVRDKILWENPAVVYHVQS